MKQMQKNLNKDIDSSDRLKIWSKKEAKKWTQAYPIGNGRLGGMIYGGISRDLIQLNEDTLWSGYPQDFNNYEAIKYLDKARQLIFNGKLSEARKLIESKMLGKYMQAYMPLGDLIIINQNEQKKNKRKAKTKLKKSHYINYKRILDLNTAITNVFFEKKTNLKEKTSKNNSKGKRPIQNARIRYEREYFASFVDQAIFIKYKVNTRDLKEIKESNRSINKSMKNSSNYGLNLRFALSSKLKHEIFFGKKERELILRGRAPSFVDAYYRNNKKKIQYEEDKGIKFEIRLKILKLDTNANAPIINFEQGKQNSDDVDALPSISVKDASEIVVAIVAATSFNGFNSDPFKNGKNPSKLCESFIMNFKNKSYQNIRQDHIDNYKKLFSRVKISFGDSKYSDLPTDERIRNIRNISNKFNQIKYYLNYFLSISFKKQMSRLGKVFYKSSENFEDPNLIALLFQFGRYLMISSSREGTQPANLQGIWNEKVIPPWASNYTININTEMNYWLVDIANLSECAEPLIRMVSELAEKGKKTAKIHYNANGWCAYHNTAIWRDATPVERNARWAFWPMGGAWLCLNLSDHYWFNLDNDYLKNVLYPLIKGVCLFLLDWLIPVKPPNVATDNTNKLNKKEYLGTCPATSPENAFIDENGQIQVVHYATTCDMALIREIFINTIKFCEILNIDMDLKLKLEETLEKFYPYQIGSKNQLLEWAKEFKEPEPGHRHMSHLIGLHPGSHITPEKTPKLAEACRKSLLIRINYGGGATGWSCAWKINLFARLKDSKNTYNAICTLIKNSLYENLFDMHPPFQIDGNFGATAGIAEMLVQSHNDMIQFLPALPKELSEGYVEGLKLRGNCLTNIYWKNSRLLKAELLPQISKTYNILSPYPIIAYEISDNTLKNETPPLQPFSSETLIYKKSEDETAKLFLYKFELKVGRKYLIKPKENY
ncbi:MAG: glycoside hydrolase family 95 protein [Promethearchaeota archaeon]